jgi:hypothetical protein
VTRAGNAGIRLRCELEPGGCAGRLRLTTARRFQSKFVRAGSHRLQIGPGGRATVTVRLSRKARELLAGRRKLRVRATVLPRDAGSSQASPRRLTLKAPRRR